MKKKYSFKDFISLIDTIDTRLKDHKYILSSRNQSEDKQSDTLLYEVIFDSVFFKTNPNTIGFVNKESFFTIYMVKKIEATMLTSDTYAFDIICGGRDEEDIYTVLAR